jgi:hypothetical protein
MKSKTFLTVVFLFCFVACTFNEVLSAIDIAIQAVSSIESQLGALSSTDSAWLTSFTNDAIQGLNTVEQDYAYYQTTCSTSGCSSSSLLEAQAAAQTLQATLNNDLQTLHISDPVKVKKITAVANIVIDAVSLVLKLAPTISQNQIGVMAFNESYVNKNITAKSLKQRWDTSVCQGEKKCRNLVKVNKLKKRK